MANSVKRTTNAKPRGKPFEKGNKLGGRKPIPEEVKQILEAATPQAAQLLVDTMNNDEVKIDTRIDCAEKILDRVHGKPKQSVDANVAGGLQIILEGQIKEWAK